MNETVLTLLIALGAMGGVLLLRPLYPPYLAFYINRWQIRHYTVNLPPKLSAKLADLEEHLQLVINADLPLGLERFIELNAATSGYPRVMEDIQGWVEWHDECKKSKQQAAEKKQRDRGKTRKSKDSKSRLRECARSSKQTTTEESPAVLPEKEPDLEASNPSYRAQSQEIARTLERLLQARTALLQQGIAALATMPYTVERAHAVHFVLAEFYILERDVIHYFRCRWDGNASWWRGLSSLLTDELKSMIKWEVDVGIQMEKKHKDEQTLYGCYSMSSRNAKGVLRITASCRRLYGGYIGIRHCVAEGRPI